MPPISTEVAAVELTEDRVSEDSPELVNQSSTGASAPFGYEPAAGVARRALRMPIDPTLPTPPSTEDTWSAVWDTLPAAHPLTVSAAARKSPTSRPGTERDEVRNTVDPLPVRPDIQALLRSACSLTAAPDDLLVGHAVPGHHVPRGDTTGSSAGSYPRP